MRIQLTILLHQEANLLPDKTLLMLKEKHYKRTAKGLISKAKMNPFRAIRLLVLEMVMIWEEDLLDMSNRCIINNLHQEWARA